MPTVSVDQQEFFKTIGEPGMSIEHFEDLCFDFGIELDEVTSEREMAQKDKKDGKLLNELSDRTILKIDVSANRYDLLCFEGLARALKIFMGKQQPPKFRLVKPLLKISVTAGSLRPYAVCAVLRDFKFTPEIYESFIDMQEKLHGGLCRRRSKVAIGTHDLDKIEGPFTYSTEEPSLIKFQALSQDKEMNASELLAHYEANDKRLAKFVPLIKDSDVYPVVRDGKGRVLSLPPIINSDFSKITLDTKNIFIECTATDMTKAQAVLKIFTTTFSEYCNYTIEQVEVAYSDRIEEHPQLEPQIVQASVEYIESCVGVGKIKNIEALLSKMGLTSEVQGAKVEVQVPPYRTDILHECDIMEDVAVAYGINNIPRTLPKTVTIGASYPLNKLTDMLRLECALSTWTEVLTLTLCSHDENFKFLGKADNDEAVTLLNPATAEYQVVRTSLLPGMFKTLLANKKTALPIKIFECADIVLKDSSSDRGAVNYRRLAAVHCSKTSGFELVHGLLDRIMQMLGVPFSATGYQIKESNLPQYFAGRQAEVIYNNQIIGSFGIVSPNVLLNYELQYPCSALELDIEHFL